MGFADLYLSKQKGFRPWFAIPPSAKLSYVVVIPAYREPRLLSAITSLWNCIRPSGHVEIIIVLNLPENAPQGIADFNAETARESEAWIRDHNSETFRFLLMDTFRMPAKDAGVGLARKRGFDEAVYRLNQISNPAGVLLSFDADSVCDANYFTAIEETLQHHKLITGFNVYFEHPLEPEDDVALFRGILQYETHLRCLNLFLRQSGFPFAYHTVGSCFGVRAVTYVSQGGMNKRKAGEDFYFLHKVIPLGGFAEINNTRVIPSSRESDRVPFGTGAAISKFLATGEEILTYAPECFQQLKQLFDKTVLLFNREEFFIESTIRSLPQPLRQYMEDMEAVKVIGEINANCGSISSYNKRFFRWFDAFRVIKFLNVASRYFAKVAVRNAAIECITTMGYSIRADITDLQLLQLLREVEKSRPTLPL